LDVAQVRIQFVEPLRPDPSALFDPVDGGVECFALEVTRSELGAPRPRDETATFEHFEMLGHRGRRHLERLRELFHRGFSGSQPGEDRAARRVGEGGEGRVEGRSIHELYLWVNLPNGKS